MKELSLHTGGHPFKIDDLLHLQAGIKETIISLIKGLGISSTANTLIIISGCNLTVTSINGGSIQTSLSDGVIYYNGELYVVKADGSDSFAADESTTSHLNQILGNLPSAYLQIQEVIIKYDGYNLPPNNEVNYEKGSYNVHIEKRMFLTANPKNGTINNIPIVSNGVSPKTLREYIEAGSGTANKSVTFGNTASGTTIASKNVDLIHNKAGSNYKILDESNYENILENNQNLKVAAAVDSDTLNGKKEGELNVLNSQKVGNHYASELVLNNIPQYLPGNPTTLIFCDLTYNTPCITALIAQSKYTTVFNQDGWSDAFPFSINPIFPTSILTSYGFKFNFTGTITSAGYNNNTQESVYINKDIIIQTTEWENLKAGTPVEKVFYHNASTGDIHLFFSFGNGRINCVVSVNNMEKFTLTGIVSATSLFNSQSI